MRVKTRLFDEIEIDPEKVIHFPGGIIGFPDLQDFVLIHDVEKKGRQVISWFQSIQEPAFAIPVIDPLMLFESYNPQVGDEMMKPLGEYVQEELLILITITVPADLKEMTVNQKAPIIINTPKRKACQIIVEGDEYAVKFPIYDLLKKDQEGIGE